MQAQVHYLESNKTRLEQEISEIEEKLNLLLTQTEAKCPLCETELGIDGLRLIETKYATEKQGKSDSLKSKQAELIRRKTELKSLESEISQLEIRLNQDRASFQSKASVLNQQIAEAEEASNKLNGERRRLAEIEQHLAGKDYAATEQQALGEIEGELAKLDYNSQRHEEVHRLLANLEQYEAPKRKLEEADRFISQEKEALSYAKEAAQELRHSLEGDNQKRQDLSKELNLHRLRLNIKP